MPSRTNDKPAANRSPQRGRTARAALAALAATTALAAGAGTAQAADHTETLQPAHTSPRSLAFRMPNVEPSRIIGAEAELFATKRARRNKAFHRDLNVERIRHAIRARRAVRLQKPVYVRRGLLQLTVADAEPPADDCAFDGAHLSAPGCRVLLEDTGAGNPAAIWGRVDCANASRATNPTGGDGLPMAGGGAQGNDTFRRMTVYDGDNVWGERCELGLNDNRTGPTALYHEGERRITFFSMRLPENYPLALNNWQTVMQMKQAQPAANAGSGPIIELNARGGSWMLVNDWAAVWKVPAQAGTWTRFAFDVTYSQDPSVGSLTAYVDLNGDGDTLDPQEQSPTLHIPTLRREIEGGSPTDGIAPGESIPSHLRMGVYHDPAIPCGSGCGVDIDNVEVVEP